MGVKKPKTEPLGLSFTCTTGNGSGGRWGEVVGCWVQGGGSVVVPRLVAQVGAAGFGAKA